MEDEADIVAVSGLAEDLRDVLLAYWVSIDAWETTSGMVWLLNRSARLVGTTAGSLRSEFYASGRSRRPFSANATDEDF